MPKQTIELIDPELSSSAMRTFADALQCVHSFKAKMTDDIQEYLLVPVQQFVKEDIREIREQRRVFERISDRYDSALGKYAALSKAKDASSLREVSFRSLSCEFYKSKFKDAFQLYDVRKTYIKAAMDYTLRLVSFKQSLDRVLLDQVFKTDYYC
jgi:hypothetical protein